MSNCKKPHNYPPGPVSPFDFPFIPQGEPGCGPVVSPAMVQPPMKLAHAYVPYQHYVAAFNPMEALEKGTLFPELYSPYPKKGVCC